MNHYGILQKISYNVPQNYFSVEFRLISNTYYKWITVNITNLLLESSWNVNIF